MPPKISPFPTEKNVCYSIFRPYTFCTPLGSAPSHTSAITAPYKNTYFINSPHFRAGAPGFICAWKETRVLTRCRTYFDPCRLTPLISRFKSNWEHKNDMYVCAIIIYKWFECDDVWNKWNINILFMSLNTSYMWIHHDVHSVKLIFDTYVCILSTHSIFWQYEVVN